MGTFRIENRVAFDAVEQLKERGASITSAKIVHFLGQESEVTDDLVACERHGAF